MTEELGVCAMLWFLALLDGAFAGYRDATGRDPRIHRLNYFRRAMLRGIIWAQSAIALAWIYIFFDFQMRPAPGELWQAYIQCASAMLMVYFPLIVATLLALVVWLAAPELDWRVLSVVTILGPITLARPLILLAGPAWACWSLAGTLPWSVQVLAWYAAISLILIEPILGRRWPERPWLNEEPPLGPAPGA